MRREGAVHRVVAPALLVLVFLVVRLEGHVLREEEQRPLPGGEGLRQGDLRSIPSGACGDPRAALGEVVACLYGRQVVGPVCREVEVVLGRRNKSIVMTYTVAQDYRLWGIN